MVWYKKWTFLDHLPTSSCKRSLWTTLYPVWQVDTFTTFQKGSRCCCFFFLCVCKEVCVICLKYKMGLRLLCFLFNLKGRSVSQWLNILSTLCVCPIMLKRFLQIYEITNKGVKIIKNQEFWSESESWCQSWKILKSQLVLWLNSLFFCMESAIFLCGIHEIL